ncbi:uncharacterized protein [Porites lutea]|uniref:uncharacterized protein isoform X3 n=1 Tax=Porites lutea TaxID=51062 RepID=UPI003CC5E307
MSRLMEDLRSIPSTASTSQEDHESNSGSTSSRKLRVTLLSSEWRSTKGGLSTINRELAIQLAKHPSLEVSVYLPQCSEEDKRAAASHSVTLIEAEEMPGLEPDLWLSCLPEDHAVDCVIGHGAVLGRQVQILKRIHHCKWIQVVHTAPEELGMYKSYADAISRGEKKHQAEVKLCEKADQVVAVGPKLAEAFSGYLRACGKDQEVLNLTPGIFSEFSDVKQATEERKTFSVLVFGRGDNEDFQLKGYDIAARAIAELKDEPQPYKLLFVGAPSGEEEKVKDLLLNQGIDCSQLTVRCFNESREQLARLFCEVDLVIMPSRTEGFGLAALEALSAGLPVLVSGNSGLGEALKKVPFASSCVVQSEDPKDWANAIKAVRGKDRKLRLREAKVLRGEYAEMYSWQDHNKRLVEQMLAISRGPSADEQNLSKKATVICQDENPPPSEKRLHKGSTKKRQSSKKGKRPLSSSNIPAPKYPRLLKDKDWYISVVVKLLKGEYKRRSQLRPLLWDSTIELPLDDVYTRLKIVSRRKADFRVDDNEVNVFDIFTALDKGEDVMTLVEGSPGIGKTTFCLKLAYDWAHGKIPADCSFPKFELMLLLKCRDIHNDIMESISEQLLPEDVEEKTKERLFNFVKDIHNQERTLIILDGLDELPKDSERYVDKLLQRRILSFCYVLATSRQERGIDVRKKYGFDILLEIKGFTESDAFDYIRKHFKNVGPLHSSKGESLIKEIEENSLLHALRNNPLNLLLLCVIYEDYEGNLPSSRSELYQVIVLCLLRRHCAKHNLEVPEENSALEKQYEETILALGELAWMCLLSDRYCFRESELAALERRYKGLVCRHVGLLYKEESLRRLKPQHEYYFLHKTFQEYLAAAFIAHKLRGNQLSLFERLSFHELVKKYREVFLFVSGILGRDAIILFTQIGEELKNWGEWNWDTCTQYGVVTMDDREREENWDNWYSDDEEDRGGEAATFLTESFSESGHAEKVTETLCSYIPFPTQVEIDLDPRSGNNESGNIYHVLDACTTFSNLQKPVRLTVYDSSSGRNFSDETVATFIQSCSQLESLTIFSSAMTSGLANALHNGLFGNTTLSEFTLQVSDSIPYDAAVAIGELLAARRALRKVTFQLDRVWGETWASAIETGLSADTLLSSVAISFLGSLNDTAIHGLGRLLSNEALTIFSLTFYGVMQDTVAAVISNVIAQQTALKSFSLNTFCNLSGFGANNLKRGLLKNHSLNDLKMTVLGKVPSNWQSVVESIRLDKKVSVTFDFDPDSCSRITHNQLAYFCPDPDVVEKELQTKQHLTVILWGELSADGAEALFEVLLRAPLASVTLRVHGKLNNSVADCVARYFRRHKTLPSMTIDVWGELAPKTRTFLQGLSSTDKTVEVRVHDVCVVPDESCNALDVCIDSIESLSPVLYKIKDTREEKINLKIINDDCASKDWTHLVGDALAENSTVTALDFTINNHTTNVTADLGKDLGECLLRSSSLTVLNLAINIYSNAAKGWEGSLVKSLSELASLTTLSLAIDDHGEVKTVGEESFGDGLMTMQSLSTLSVVINGSNLEKFWSYFLRNCLKENNSLSLLCVTVNNYADDIERPDYSFDKSYEEPDYWYEGLADGLARTTSLNELTLTINNITLIDNCWVESVCEGFVENESVTTLTVTVSGDSSSPGCESWVSELNKGLTKNNSLTTLTLIANEYSEGELWEGGCLLWDDEKDSAENTSLTTLNLTFNIRTEVSEDWLSELCDCLVNSSSLTTLRLNVNNHCATNESRLYDLSKLRLKFRSLSSFELTVTFYGE